MNLNLSFQLSVLNQFYSVLKSHRKCSSGAFFSPILTHDLHALSITVRTASLLAVSIVFTSVPPFLQLSSGPDQMLCSSFLEEGMLTGCCDVL